MSESDSVTQNSGEVRPAASEGKPPVTIIVVHPRERRSKCSVEPLRGRDDFEFVRFPDPVTLPLDGYIRLGLGGPVLSEADADAGLLVLDGTWKLAARMEPFYKHVPVRTLPPMRTAYPRVSKILKDPIGGLATVEAVFGALDIMKRSTDGLLDSYHWKDEFLNYYREDQATIDGKQPDGGH